MDETTKQQLLEMLTALGNTVSGFDAQIAAMKSSVEAAVIAVPQAGGAPQAGELPVSDKIYTQVDLDKAVNEAVLPLQAKIGQLESQISDLNTGIETRVSEAVEGFKSQLVAAYEAQQVAETQAETGFKDLLKPQVKAEAPVTGEATPEVQA